MSNGEEAIGGNLMVIVFCDGIKESLWYPPFRFGAIAWRERESSLG